MGLEGIVSKRRDRRYRAGRSQDWIKVKNPDAPAMLQVRRRVAVIGANELLILARRLFDQVRDD